MNDAPPPPPRQPIALVQNNSAGLKLVSFEDVQRVAKWVFTSGLIPKTLDTPEKIGVALLHGMEIGLPPMMSLQRIAVINGVPTVFGDAALAVCEASGRLMFIKEYIVGKKLDDPDTHAVCELQRKGKPEPIQRTYSIGDAMRAGLLNKGGPWKSNPARMLQMRARGFALRDTFADILGGLYLHEELEGEGNIDAPRPMRDVTPAPMTPMTPMPPTIDDDDQPPAPPVRASKAATVVEPDPEADQELGDSLPPEGDPDATEAQLENLDTMFETLEAASDSEMDLKDWRTLAEEDRGQITKAQWNQLMKAWTRKLENLMR